VGPASLRQADAVWLDCDSGIALRILPGAKGWCYLALQAAFRPTLTRTADSETAESVLDRPIEVPA
jgi:hypothetical protein